MTTATTAMATTASRRAWLARLLLAAAMAPVLGVRLADTADASKKGKKKATSIKKRAEVYENTCTAGGGTATTTKLPGGTTVACTGHKAGDWACTVHSKGSRCHATRTTPPQTPLDDVHTSPTGGVQPTDGDSGGGDGDQPWQGDLPENPPILEPVEGGGSEPPLL
jgi:hypothetical protein